MRRHSLLARLTSSALLNGSTQAKVAIFFLDQIQSEDITEDLQISFAKLLPHSLFYAKKLPELTLGKAKTSLFCLQIAFAKLLLFSLLDAEKLPELTQAKAKAALFYLKQIQIKDITEDLQIAFAKLLSHFLLAEKLPNLRTASAI